MPPTKPRTPVAAVHRGEVAHEVAAFFFLEHEAGDVLGGAHVVDQSEVEVGVLFGDLRNAGVVGKAHADGQVKAFSGKRTDALNDLAGIAGFKVFDLNAEGFGGPLAAFVGALVKALVGFSACVVGHAHADGSLRGGKGGAEGKGKSQAFLDGTGFHG